MATMKYDIPFLDRNTRFSLWQDVLKEKTTAALWLKFEQLCMMKSLTSKLHLKQQLYSHRMIEDMSLKDHLTILKEVVFDLETMKLDLRLRQRVFLFERGCKRNFGGDARGRSKSNNKDKTCRTLGDVRHVLNLKRNLILLSILDSKWYKHTSEGGVLKGSIVTSDVTITTPSLLDSDVNRYWHMRLGHMSENGMVELSRRELLNGPSKVPFKGGASYMLTIIDDFSRKVWVFFFKQKSDVLATFNEWKIMIEKHTGKQSEGIVRHHTVHHTPQQNGVTERMNKTLMEKARCMLSNVGLPKSFWAEVASTTCFIINLSFNCYWQKDSTKETKKVIVNRNVIFDETAMLHDSSSRDSCDKEQQKSSTQVEFEIGSRSIPEFTSQSSSEMKSEPSTYLEAVNCDDSSKWMISMKEEMESLHKNGTWDSVRLLKIVKHSSIQPLLGIVIMHDFELEQLDVKTTFLCGELEEDIYMQQPKGFIVSGKEDYVCLLKKSLYGLKQSPR
ncbi:Retrovirus-related Pol polyprotein from transposon TNT 1-94 [Vitis vinifera]|uniref:Retrovirus-related Pol polyprotein from transposon TNT 1-94 n=1 Tax=Vitis vinifera TaxID=29760 RepID=A0A438JVM5_VITVI|nr:Retrovirus-related Pol polyprotein from transposon TNT 1-94 [Vitis vinifera]